MPETRTFNGLLRACRAAKDAARASRLYARMVRLGPPPDTVTVSVVLSAVATGGTVDPDWAVAAFQRGGVRAAADPGAVAALAYALRCGPSPPPQDAADAAFDAFDVLRSEYRAADAWATAEILHLAAAAGAPARARSAWTAAVGDNVAPTPHMYSALFVAAATAAAQSADAALVTLADRAGARLRRDWDREVAAAAPRPPPPRITRSHLVAHNALMHFLAACARCDDARMLLDVMLVAGPPPDVVTLNAALDAAAQAGDVDAAFAVHGLASGVTVPVTGASGAGVAAITPDVETFGGLLHACARAGAADDAAAVMAAMADAGIEPSVQAYTSYMSALVAAEARASIADADTGFSSRGRRGTPHGGAVAVATSVLDDMLAAGLAPTAVTYGVLLSAASAAGDADSALRFYSDAADRGVALTDECHAKLAIAVANAGRPDDALAAVRS
ncbi:MAG: hypothetical protein ORN28_07765, partial [Rhodoferax sp.]|nr:hypothetical protein [Rhodoferax sp.]